MTAEVEYISERIAIKRGAEDLTIHIKASSRKDEKKLKLLKIWTLLWTVVGLLIISQFFFPYEPKEKLFFVIYLFFWGYFEYKIAYAYYFRRYGTETLYLSNDKFLVRRDIYNRKGKAKFYKINGQHPFSLVDDGPNTLMKSYYNSFWIIQGGTIAFGQKPKEYRFGLQLPEADASRLVKLLNKFVKTFPNPS